MTVVGTVEDEQGLKHITDFDDDECRSTWLQAELLEEITSTANMFHVRPSLWWTRCGTAHGWLVDLFRWGADATCLQCVTAPSEDADG